MERIFNELVEISRANCAVCFSAVADKILYVHDFNYNSHFGKQILRLLKRVSKLKQLEFCGNTDEDPLFKAMGISSSFVCYPLLHDDAALGAIYLGSSTQEQLRDAGVEKKVELLSGCYYEKLRNQTREEIESQTQVSSQRLKRYLSMGMSCGGRKIVGIDPIMEEQVFSSIEMYKTENCSPVLIYGESGTGKELVASALHYRSERQESTYLRFNCAEIASVDPQMQRIELFGCKAGIATGVMARKGLFLLADKGTLFLDEIGLLSMEAQGQLLRVLEDSKIRPVGEKNDIKVDVRLIYANNRSLQQLVREGKFREDLFYRICSFVINIPPLRQRGIHDHNLLIDYFIEEENEKNQGKKSITSKARSVLHQHHWPGNVRELRATIRRAYYRVSRPEGAISEKEIEFVTHEEQNSIGYPAMFPRKLSEIEREVFRQASIWAAANPRERTQGHAAEILGIHPNTMTKKLREYEIIWPKQ